MAEEKIPEVVLAISTTTMASTLVALCTAEAYYEVRGIRAVAERIAVAREEFTEAVGQSLVDEIAMGGNA